MKRIRSILFVPGNRPKWIEKIPTFGADAIILDLEDSVPDADKSGARQTVAESIGKLHAAKQRVFVRTNKKRYIYDYEDLKAVVRPGLEGILVPKPEGVEDIELAAKMVAEAEAENGVEVGSVKFIPALETARAAEQVFQIASHSRICTVIGATARNADVSRSIGFQWTPEGLEGLYFKSRVVLACRAAGVRYPLGGMWQDVHDLAGLRKAAEWNRTLGFSGEVIIHPGSVPVINEVFSLSKDDKDYYRGIIDAFEAAEKAGKGAVMYRGEHIDIAHVKTARQLLESE